MSNKEIRAQASELRLSISRQKKLLDDMERELRDLERPLYSIVYPVLTLPPEITSEIFLHCLPAPPSLSTLDTEKAPSLLMHVCSAWRQIAVSTPKLWKTLSLDLEGIEPHFSEIFEVWLGRACEGPLSVKIIGSLSEIDDFGQDFGKMDGNSLAFPGLQDLSIQAEAWDEEDNVIEMFDNAPALREVWMNYIPPPFITLPWEQLTKFKGESYTVDECLDALRLMPALVECALSAFPAGGFSSEPISHSNITSLTLFKSSPEQLGISAASNNILGFLTLPNLHTLEIVDPEPEDFDDEVFESFLKRSAPPLRNLIIRGEVEISFISFFAVPDLTHLEIWRPPFGFTQLLFDFFGHDTSLFPRLQNLFFLGCQDERNDDKASVVDIVNMAAAPMTERRSNRKGFAPLQSFRVVSQSGVPFVLREEQLLPFKNLKAEGMAIHIGTETESCV
ncbi:hypothetical protein DFH09DRAFT_1316118 [Mycena vulgaris]|nr:hypothetical protein DFH09DRAFT_1316118 [Mycena vulgaris]